MHHILCHSLTPTQTTEQFFADFNNVAWDDDTTSTEEHFPTAPLDDEVWCEDPILDRPLCIHERPHKPNLQCSYPCPYSTTTCRMVLPQSTPHGAAVLNYEQMEFSDISSDFPDNMMTTSNDDIPDLEDISNFEQMDNIKHEAWFA